MKTEQIAISELKSHPKNYRSHPQDQLDHLVQSIKEHGLYRAIVVADDLTILAGHGLYKALQVLEYNEVPIVKLPIKSDSALALKLLAADNEIAKLSEIDDRILSENLKEIKLEGLELLGTGYDDLMLANLVMVTRPASEIADKKAAAEWAGMPDYDEEAPNFKAVVHFDSLEKRTEFLELLEIKNVTGIESKTCSFRWPNNERNDLKSVIIEEA